MIIVLEVNKEGSKFWSKEVEKSLLLYHRDNDMPAMIFSDGEKRWYKEDVLIREEIPPSAFEDYYYLYGVRCKEDK